MEGCRCKGEWDSEVEEVEEDIMVGAIPVSALEVEEGVEVEVTSFPWTVGAQVTDAKQMTVAAVGAEDTEALDAISMFPKVRASGSERWSSD